MPGPLPQPTRRRRNAPTIPTTELPAGGRPGQAPKPPAWVRLGASGTAWWKWAWKTPQAAAWSKGDLAMICRRALLEDMLAVRDLSSAPELSDLLDLLDGDDDRASAAREVVEGLVRALAFLATGAVTIMRECRELDDRLGLTPKGLAALRWRIVEKPAASTSTSTSPSTSSTAADPDKVVKMERREERRARLEAGGA